MKHTMANSLVKYSDEGYPIKSPEDGVKLNDKLFKCFIPFPFFFLIYYKLRFYNQKVNLNSINFVTLLKINCWLQ